MNSDERVALEERIHRSSVLQKVFAGKEGAEALKIIDEISGYRANTFKVDPYQHAYNAGCKAFALFIHNIMDGDVEKAMKFLGETNE